MLGSERFSQIFFRLSFVIIYLFIEEATSRNYGASLRVQARAGLFQASVNIVGGPGTCSPRKPNFFGVLAIIELTRQILRITLPL